MIPLTICVEALLELGAARRGAVLLAWEFADPVLGGMAKEACRTLLEVIAGEGVEATYAAPKPPPAGPAP